MIGQRIYEIVGIDQGGGGRGLVGVGGVYVFGGFCSCSYVMIMPVCSFLLLF